MGKKLSIIVVDDQPDAAQTIGMLLSMHGHSVQFFTSAREVLEAVVDLSPDVILADLGMPEMDGCELAVRIRQIPDCERTVLVALTGFADHGHLQAAIAAGFDYRFVKPIPAADLYKLIGQIASHGK